MARFTEYLEKIYRKSQFCLVLSKLTWLPLISIFYLTAEATRLERALTQPFESDDQGDDLDPDNMDENSPDGRTKPVEKDDIPQPPTAPKATTATKKKQSAQKSARQKSSSKTIVEGMYFQFYVSVSCWTLVLAVVGQRTSESMTSIATVPHASTVVSAALITSHIDNAGSSNTTDNSTSPNTESISWKTSALCK